MSELSDLVTKLETEAETLFHEIEPVVVSEFDSLVASFKAQVGPDILLAGEDAVPIAVAVLTGTVNPNAALTEIEALGKTLADTIIAVAKALATKQIVATGTQIVGALAAKAAQIQAANAAAANQSAAPSGGVAS